MKKKIIIIGGGITGCMAALHIDKKNFDVSIYESKNNLGGIYKSKKCLEISLKYIKDNPTAWFHGRFINILKSHVKFAIDHGFSPNGWKKYFGFISEIKFFLSS